MTWKARPLLHPRYGSPAAMQRTVTSEKNPSASRASPIKTPETRHDPHSSRLRPSVDGTFLLDKERISPHLQIRHSDYASGTAETQPVRAARWDLQHFLRSRRSYRPCHDRCPAPRQPGGK